MGDSVLDPGVLSPSTGTCVDTALPHVTMEGSVCELMPWAGILELLLALTEGGREGGRIVVCDQCVTSAFTLGTV